EAQSNQTRSKHRSEDQDATGDNSSGSAGSTYARLARRRWPGRCSRLCLHSAVKGHAGPKGCSPNGCARTRKGSNGCEDGRRLPW
ncbi:unnamed protein product, partial [Ectocarpus sp. 12 AP-2014]